MFRRTAVCVWIGVAVLAASDDHELGARLHEQGNYRDAEMLYARSVERWEKVYGAKHPGLIRLLNTLAALHLDARQFEKAEAETERALEIQRMAPGVMPVEDEATTLIHLGSVRRALRQFDESEQAYLRAVEILRPRTGPNDHAMANVWNNLGALYAERGMPERAAFYLEQSALAMGEGCSQDGAITLTNFASISDRAGRTETAGKAFQRAADCARQAFGPEHRQTANTLAEYAGFLRKTHQKREAARLEEEARDIRTRAARSDPGRLVVDARELQAASRKR
jgi:tetratricopeptide (TPR) repeat protein